MNIVHIGTGIMSIPPIGVGAVENAIYELSKKLVKYGNSVDIIDIKSNIDRGKTGIVFCEVKIPSLCDVHPLLQVLSFAYSTIPKLYYLLKEKPVDIIHSHSQFAGLFVLIAKSIFKWHIVILYTTHNTKFILNPSLLNRIKHIAESILLKRIDHIFTPTISVKNTLVSHFGLNSLKITSIHYGLEVEKIKEYINYNKSNREKRHIVMYPARICRRKNQLALVRASIGVLKEVPDTMFIFAGPVDEKGYFNSLQKFIKENNLTSNIEFTGPLPRQKIYELYKKASIFVFPTLYETQGIVLIEAMAFGVPVIASDIGPVRDVVGLIEGSAVLIDPQNQEQIAQKIIHVLKDMKLRETLSHKGKKLVKEYFSWDRIAVKTAETYQQLVKKHTVVS